MTNVSVQSRESRHHPVLGCIADDVTGATDLALNLVQGGMRTVQLSGVPEDKLLSQLSDTDALVLALKTRSIPKMHAVQQSLAALRVLQKLGIRRFFFKYCSTFDSTDEGNIGPVAEALIEELGVEQTIYCPAFPAAGRTVYRGHLFVGNRLLNESGLEHHPVNPMTDANLVRVLGRQTTRKVGLLSVESYEGTAEDVAGELARLRADGVAHVITDACNDRHLELLADVVAEMPLITGGSGIARYLPDRYRTASQRQLPRYVPSIPKVPGRDAILAGSCSSATLAQVEWMRPHCPTWPVNVAAVMENPGSERDRIIGWAGSVETDKPLLVYSTASTDEVTRLQETFGRAEVSQSLEQFLASVAQAFVDHFGVRRLVLAGGETAGAIVNWLGIQALRIGPEICTGVPWTESVGSPPLAVALKSGNFGGENFFQKALEMLA